MPALMRQIALVSESELIPAGDVSKVAAAIQKQAARDLSPIWEINATVDVFARLEDVPVGYWSVIVRDDIDDPSAAGIHEDENGQPFALVTASSDINVWSITASHEALEMLVDPSGNRLVAANSKPQGRRVNYLVEVCDPSEAAKNAYSCNGIFVSDFYHAELFRSGEGRRRPVFLHRRDHRTPAGAPRRLPFVAGSRIECLVAGNLVRRRRSKTGQAWTYRSKANGNVRAVIDRETMPKTIRTLSAGRKQAKAAGLSPGQNQAATNAHAQNLRARIDQILGRSSEDRPAREWPVASSAEPDRRRRRRGRPRTRPAAPRSLIDQVAAVQYGLLINAVYSMYTRSQPTRRRRRNRTSPRAFACSRGCR